MIAPGVPFEEINQGHLEALIAGGVGERRTIEYKRELPGGGDEAKREFLADVSSFANASGGDLVYGVEAKEGLPVALRPLTVIPDQEGLRWEQIVRDGIAPRVAGIRVRFIEVEGAHVLLFRIPKSWGGPHAVTYKGAFRFHSRTSAGKYPLDVGELRSALLAGSNLGDQIRTFRADRLAAILGGGAPIVLTDGPKIVVHLVPYDAFATQPDLDPSMQAGSGLFKPLFLEWGGTERWNIDGLLTLEREPTDSSTPAQPAGPLVNAYSQLFRSGIFEGVNVETLAPAADNPDLLYGWWFEKALNTGLANPLEVQRRIGVKAPLVVLVSVVGAQGYQLRDGRPLVDRYPNERRIDRTWFCSLTFFSTPFRRITERRFRAY
jgi:hypothetical protein